MRILLQHVSTGRFLTQEGAWAEAAAHARVFTHFLEAFFFARKHVQGPVGAYCDFDDPAYNFSVLLSNEAGALQCQASAERLKGQAKVTDGETDNGLKSPRSTGTYFYPPSAGVDSADSAGAPGLAP
ncbi:MAG: hypothetical protein U1G07_12970 [Verrucomicrobiota bacterium]